MLRNLLNLPAQIFSPSFVEQFARRRKHPAFLLANMFLHEVLKLGNSIQPFLFVRRQLADLVKASISACSSKASPTSALVVGNSFYLRIKYILFH